MTESPSFSAPTEGSQVDGHPILVGGTWQTSDQLLESRKSWDGEIIGSTFLASEKQYEEAGLDGLRELSRKKPNVKIELGQLLRKPGAHSSESRMPSAAAAILLPLSPGSGRKRAPTDGRIATPLNVASA